MKITIITPTLNNEKTILDTLDSVSGQTYQNIEHLIIDGGSKDQTLKIIDYKFEASGNIKKSKIKFIEPNNFLFVKNTIKSINLEKSDFKINYGKKDEKILNINGSYKINDNSFQKFNLKHFYNLNSQLVDLFN